MKIEDIFCYFDNSHFEPQGDTYVAVMPRGISGVRELFEALNDRLSFPWYFGFNWNAVSDCLRDFHWIKEKKILLIHEEIPQVSIEDLYEYIDVLKVCIHRWSSTDEHQLVVTFPKSCRDAILEILEALRVRNVNEEG